MLHMYLVTARLRGCDPDVYKAWQAQLVNHFFYNAEAKMGDEHAITSGMMRQRYLKDLFVQWRGVMLAYDEGVAKGDDAVLASAVWRNLYKGRGNVDVRALAGVVGFMRRCLADWDKLEDDQFLALLLNLGLTGRIGGPPKDLLAHIASQELRAVDRPAAAMAEVYK